MKVSYIKGLANHNSPESCVAAGNFSCEALTGGGMGQVLSREMFVYVQSADVVDSNGRQHGNTRNRKSDVGSARSKTLCTYPSTPCRSWEIPCLAGKPVRNENSEEVQH
jgi:hypothetical protein